MIDQPVKTITHAVTERAVQSIKWSALTEIVSRVASPIIFVIMARLLAPSDYGVVAIASIAISFSAMFWDAGLSKALIQIAEAAEAAAHVVFWTNVALGFFVYLLLFVSAPAIALFFNSPASGPVLRALGLQIIISPLTSVQQALFVRDFRFRDLFRIKLLTAFTPGLFSIPLAFFGYGAWALVAGTLASQLLNSLLLWKNSSWRPRLDYDLVIARKLFRFGSWVLLEGLGGWLIVWGDNLIVGRYMGVHDLGVYSTGWNLAAIIFGLVLNPFLPVLYPTFSRLQGDLPALRDTFHRVNRIIISIALPMGCGLLLVGPETALFLFGQKWQGLGFVLAVLGCLNTVAWLVGVNAEIYRAIGRPDVNTKFMFAQLSYYLPIYYFAAQHGLEVFTLSRLAAALISTPVHIYLCVRMLKVSPLYLWHQGKRIILSAIVMAFGVAALKWGVFATANFHYTAVPFAILILTGCIIYLSILSGLERGFVLQTLRLLKRAAK